MGLPIIINRSCATFSKRAKRTDRPIKRRWVVERTLAWVVSFRRHAREYEVLTRRSEALIQIAMIHLLLKRIK